MSLSVAESSSVGAYVQMIAILGFQLIVSSNIRLLIFLMCKKFFAVLSVIRRPTHP